VVTPRDYPIHGVDLSSFQGTWLVPQMIDFAIVRATFGVKRDKRTVEHVEALRKRTACAIGLYHFYVPGQSTSEQMGAFEDAADACGIVEGDLIPWVDVESPKGDGSMPPRPEWCEQLHDVVLSLQEMFGQAGIYITQRDWALLGKPEWMLELPLWVAHWRSSPGAPASPGGVPPVLWQYRVGPWARGGLHTGQHAHPRAIDHDCCVASELPRIVAPGEPIAPTLRLPAIPWLGLDSEDWEHMRLERDVAAAGDDDAT
jgi:GH25 family lysozyme M1 (1,4-beta-N-acetylmuramidase)